MNHQYRTLPPKAVGRNSFALKNENSTQKNLTPKTRLNYIKNALANASASRGKLNLLLANNSAPNCAFFVRCVRAPLPNNLSFDRLFSMVERSGKGFALCRFPVMTVFHPVTFYRPTVESLAVVFKNLLLEIPQMYQFIFALMRTPTRALKIRVIADNEHQARARFTCGNDLLFVGRINLHSQNTHQNNRTFAQRGLYA